MDLQIHREIQHNPLTRIIARQNTRQDSLISTSRGTAQGFIGRPGNTLVFKINLSHKPEPAYSRLMIECGVGVSAQRVVKVMRIDGDYFEESEMQSNISKFPYFTKEQNEIETLAVNVLLRTQTGYMLLLSKHKAMECFDVNAGFLKRLAQKIALGLITWDIAIDRAVTHYEGRLTKVLQYIHESEVRESFFDDSQLFLNQIYELKTRRPPFVADIPVPFSIKRLPVGGDGQRPILCGVPAPQSISLEVESASSNEDLHFDAYRIVPNSQQEA